MRFHRYVIQLNSLLSCTNLTSIENPLTLRNRYFLPLSSKCRLFPTKIAICFDPRDRPVWRSWMNLHATAVIRLFTISRIMGRP